jgi:hypothetical protein
MFIVRRCVATRRSVAPAGLENQPLIGGTVLT